MAYVIHRPYLPAGVKSYDGPVWDTAGLRHRYKEAYDTREEATALANQLCNYVDADSLGFIVSEARLP